MNTFFRFSTLALATCCLLAAGYVSADNRDGGGWKRSAHSPEAALARMDEQLDLTDQQAVEMLVVLQQQAEQRAAIREQGMELLGPQICAQRAETEQEILAILTPEQTEQFIEMKEQRKARAAERRQGRGGKHHDCSLYESGA